MAVQGSGFGKQAKQDAAMISAAISNMLDDAAWRQIDQKAGTVRRRKNDLAKWSIMQSFSLARLHIAKELGIQEEIDRSAIAATKYGAANSLVADYLEITRQAVNKRYGPAKKLY